MTAARVETAPAVWWHTQRGPLVGLVPGSRLDLSEADRGRWYVAVLTPTRPDPHDQIAQHWRLSRFARQRSYTTANTKFNKVMKKNGGPAKRASAGVALPDRTPLSALEQFLDGIWYAIVRLTTRIFRRFSP